MFLKRSEQQLILDGKVYTLLQLEELIKDETGPKQKQLNDLLSFLTEWFDKTEEIVVRTSGSTGIPKSIWVQKEKMIKSACITCEYLGLQQGDTALLCMPLQYIAGMMMVIRALVARLDLRCVIPSGHPLSEISIPLDFVAMVPSQVFNSLQNDVERKRLSKINTLIIGGGAIDDSLIESLSQLPNKIYSTYGMTETLSHIALRRLNGSDPNNRYYPFSSVKLSLSDELTLIIDAPLVCNEVLKTNDVAELYDDGSFMILGRKDNIINSGGIKIQAEKVEQLLNEVIASPFAITSIAHSKWGEAIVLLVEDSREFSLGENLFCKLPKYWRPLYTISVASLPMTETGKIDRIGCKKLAAEKVKADYSTCD